MRSAIPAAPQRLGHDSRRGLYSRSPASLTETVERLDNPILGPVETHFFATRISGGTRYAVVYADLPEAFITSAADVLAEARRSDERKLGGQATEQRELTAAGQPALEYRIETRHNVHRVRLVLAGTRLYALSVTGTAEATDGPDARAFLDSFALVGE